MILTKRKQEGYIMSRVEKVAYIKIIRNMPWLYGPILRSLKPIALKAKTLIDIGCGDGYLLALINKQFPHLELQGIDVDKFMITAAKKSSTLNFKLLRAENFRDKADIIITNLSLHHFKNPKAILKKLYKLSNNALVVADQIRPATKKDLEKRLAKRGKIIKGRDEYFYEKNEKASILEAYSKKEVIGILDGLKIKYKMQVFDKDYYERYVAIFKK